MTQNKKKRNLNIAAWNIRRGLIIKENELVHLLHKDEIDFMFLTETDTSLHNAEMFHIKGYTTHIQLCGEKKMFSS